MTRLTRRAMIAGIAGATLIVKQGHAAEYKFSQYHNQATGVPLHRNLVAMWDAIRAETNGRVEATVYPENNKLVAGDPAALKMLIAGEIQFFTLMGGIIGTVVPVAEAQQVPFAFKSAPEAHVAIDGPLEIPAKRREARADVCILAQRGERRREPRQRRTEPVEPSPSWSRSPRSESARRAFGFA